MGQTASVLAEIGALVGRNPAVFTGGAGLAAGASTVAISERMADKASLNAQQQRERSRDELDAEQAEKQAKLDAMRASAQDVAVRRQAHDLWRHEPRGPTKYALAQRELRAYEEMMRNRPPKSPEQKKEAKEEVFVTPREIRQRGAPKTKPKLPDTPPNPFDNKAFEDAKALRGTSQTGIYASSVRSLVPAPTIREKTATAFHREGSAGPSTAAPSTGAPKTAAFSNGASARGGFRPPEGEKLDLSDEVDDLIADLERSDITKETNRNSKTDEYKRRSEKVLYEKPNLDWLATELEVFDKELHTEEMGKIRNTKAKSTGPSRREKAKEERSKLAASKLPDDLLPY